MEQLVFAEPNLLNPQVALMFRVNALKPYFAVSPDEMAFSRFQARRALRRAGFVETTARPFDFVHPSLPASTLPAGAAVGRFLEALPLVSEIAGSLLITARRE